ncbi:MAG TPA: adenosylcobinamide-GDP ribazoletransferase, partial [Paracoccaceae bacterium]|nr:adenosylcobinamide-GDP ribazoletransferase [Paracoccaceae bacterium]
ILLARWSGIADFSGWRAVFVLMAVGATSRAIMVVPMSLMPNARASGLSASAGIASRDAMLVALGIAALIGLVFTGFSGIAALAVAAVASLPLLALAHYKLGGQTGDVLGGTQQCAEVGALLAFTALL